MVTGSLLQAPAGKLADMMNKKLLVVIASLIGAVYMGFTPLAGGFWFLLTVVIMAGVRSAFTTSGTSGLMVEEGRKFGMGSTMAMFSMAISIGEGVGPLCAGAIVDAVGVTGNFYASSGMMLIAALIFCWFARPLWGQTAPPTSDKAVLETAREVAVREEDEVSG
jgi:predicted MFS family arabinose efflux permease